MSRTWRIARPEAPDQTALAAGLCGLALTGFSALTRALLAAVRAGGTVRPVWAAVVLLLISLAGFGLGVLAIWSAIKAWLRNDTLSVPARWGGALGLAAMGVVVAFGPCGAQSCPG